MEVKTQAVVLHAIKYGDNQLIVDLLTRQMGRQSFICRVPKTGKARVKKQFFQPLTMLLLTYDYRPKARLQHLRDVQMSVPFTSIPYEPVKLSLSLFLAEFLLYATRNEQENEPMYDYVTASIRWLDAATGPTANFHLVFMMHMTRFIGFYPNLSDYEEGAYFDLRSGTFTPQRPPHPDFLQPDEAARMGLLMRMDYETMHLFHMSRADRNRIADVIIMYYRLHLPAFPELKSLDVLREMYGGDGERKAEEKEKR